MAVISQESGPMRMNPIAAGSAGAVLGAIGARVVFVGSGLSLVPWTVCGLALGGCSTGRRQASANGTAYGFMLAFVFMAAGYDGAASMVTRLPFFAALGVIGAGAGLSLTTLGRLMRIRLRHEEPTISTNRPT